MSSAFDNVLKYEYLLRLNRVIDYVQHNYAENLSPAKLAKIACFSPFHFDRMFRDVFGETVNRFVRRTRLEKALIRLAESGNLTVNEVALECGFENLQNFNRAFDAHYGLRPSFMAKESSAEQLKAITETSDGMDGQELTETDSTTYEGHNCLLGFPITKLLNRNEPMKVAVIRMPSYRVAYVRLKGPLDVETYKPARDRLKQWALSKGLTADENIRIGVAWNKPAITPKDQWIHDICITIPDDMDTDRDIHTQYLPGGLFAVRHCEVSAYRSYEEWMSLTVDWLATSGYKPNDPPYYEIYYNHPQTHPSKKLIVDLCLHIKPMQE